MRTSWLERQPSEFRAGLMSLSHVKTYKRGSTIAHMGDELDALIGIVEGCVEIHWDGFGRQSYHIQNFWPGDWIGEYALITGKPRKISAIARTDVKAGLVPANKLMTMLEEHPAGWRSIADLANEHLGVAVSCLISRLHSGKDARCTAVLLSLAPRRTENPELCGEVFVPINHAQLAQLSSLSRNSVGAALKNLKKKGLVDLTYNGVRILSLPDLATHLDNLLS